jgi:hypothetical protein
MKTNLKLNNSLSLKALEAQARKAAAIAAIKPQVAPSPAQAAPTARKVAVAMATPPRKRNRKGRRRLRRKSAQSSVC